MLVRIYGSKQNDMRPAVRSQNPDIERLGEVLAHAQGHHVLETTGDLDAAHTSTEPVDRQFTASPIRTRTTYGTLRDRSEPVTGVIGRFSTSPRTSRKPRKSCTRAWRTNYREDQWLRLWFLGGEPVVPHDRGDDRHYSKETYWEFVQASWKGLGSLLAERARVVIRVGGRALRKAELREGLLCSLASGLNRDIRLVDDGVSSEVGNTRANAFRGAKASRLVEHDFCFVAQEC